MKCIRRVITGGSNGDSATSETQWESEHDVASRAADDGSGRSVVPVLFDIPYDAPPTDLVRARDKTLWRLQIASAAQSSRYRAEFEVPVFTTAESDPAHVADRRPIDAAAAPADPQRAIRAAGIVCTPAPDGDGLRFFFPSGRNRGMAIGFTLFAAVWTAVCWGLWHFGASLIVAAGFSFFELLIVPLMFDLWLYQSTIDVSPARIAVQKGWLGIGARREFSPGDVERIQAVRGMTSGSQIFYNLVLVGRDGKKIRIAKSVKGIMTAKAVIRVIERAMGRS